MTANVIARRSLLGKRDSHVRFVVVDVLAFDVDGRPG